MDSTGYDETAPMQAPSSHLQPFAPPARGLVCYHLVEPSGFTGKAVALRPKTAGSFHVGNDPAFDESMKSSWALLAVLSIGTACVVSCKDERQGAARGDRRLIEPRLIGLTFHEPCRVDPDAPDLIPDARCAEPSDIAIHPAEDVRPRGGGARDRDFRGVYLLAALGQGRTGWIDKAVERLRRAAVANPEDARVWSDLAAAYLVRAERLDDPRDLVRAYVEANRAVFLDGCLPEALFNRALALERLFLIEEAKVAWRSFLDVEWSGPWRKEGEERLLRLEQGEAETLWDDEKANLRQAALAGRTAAVESIVRSHRQAAREHAELELLGEWADAAAKAGAARAQEALAVARAIGSALSALGGDLLVRDAVAAIDAATRESDPRRLQALIEGHRRFRRGHASYLEGETSPALADLAAAREALARAGSPFAARAAFFLSCSEYVSSRYPQALSGFESLDRELAGSSYTALLAHALGMEALSLAVEGRLMSAVGIFEKSLTAFQSAGEGENVAWAEALLAENLQLIGRDREAWKHLYRALRTSPGTRNPRHLYLYAKIAADGALREEAPEVALLFYDEMVRQAAHQPGNHVLAAESLFWRGLIAANSGLQERALEDLRNAEHRIGRIEDETLRHRKQADLALVKSEATLTADPHAAISRLTPALRVYQESGLHMFALRVLLTRARAYRLAGDDSHAKADLEKALLEYEKAGRNPSEEDLRLAFLEKMDVVSDELIDLQARRRPDLALASADRARTRVLPASAARLADDRDERRRLLGAEPHPLGIDEIRRRLPAGTTIVQYSVLADRFLIWLIRSHATGREIPFYSRPVSREELEDLAGELRAFRDDEAWERTSSRLFDLLIRPWRTRIREGELLVFVPDKVLHAVPFAALRERETGRFLLEGHDIAFSPSATLYVNALAHEPGAQSGPPRVLVVGNPAFDTNVFSLLPLPDAEKEAIGIAALHGTSALTGSSATRAAFLAGTAQADWIHFAGHAEMDERNPLLSRLALAPGRDGDPGVLSIRDIYSLRLDRTRLVVLAACRTGDLYVPGGEGMTSFARAFLAAGARSVVGTLWNVDDHISSRLLETFHQNLLAGQDPASALRTAQRRLLASSAESERSPAAWGAFAVFGASVD
jgi:CHAT domain-containing protein